MAPRASRSAALDLDRFYQRILAAWHVQVLAKLEPVIRQFSVTTADPLQGEGMARIDAALAEPVRAALDGLQIRMGEEFEPGKLRGPLARYAKQVEGSNRKVQLSGINPLHASPGLATASDVYLTNNIRLIRSIPDRELGEVQKIFANPETKTLRVEQIRKLVQERFEVSKSRATLIARDQTLKLNGQITKVRQQRAGVSRYIWTTSADERVRGNPDGTWPKGNHWELDGTIQDWNAPPIVDERTGRRGHPGEDYQCRCTAVPFIEGVDDAT